MSKPSSAKSGDSSSTQAGLDDETSTSEKVDVNSPTYIIGQALSPKDQEDFFQAFFHYFVNTSSPVTQTITVRELGFIFRAFGQRVPDKELRQLIEKYGTSLSHWMGGGSSGNLDRALKKQTSFIEMGDNSEQQQPSLGDTKSGGGGGHANNFASGRFGGIPQPPPNNNNSSRQGSRPTTGVFGPSSTSTAPSTANMKVLTWTQFLVLMAKQLQSNDSDTALGDAFDVFDVKKQGYVMDHELRQFMTLLGDSRLSESEVEKMIKEADVDGDGSIDKDEFIKMLQK